jgi:signal transduction histidine kinase
VAATTDPVTILLVDDQPGRLLSYRAILEPLGERLIEANSGDEALRCLMREECALILLDVNMPGMDGFETASLIHQHPRFERTPIIFVTAVNVSDFDRMRGYKLGAVDYVMVPIIPEILRSKVMVLAELFRKRRDLQLANETLAAANTELQLEKSRVLEALNESLRVANTELGDRNVQLQLQIGERERAEARLLTLDRRKDEFLATLAHELRNPLASLSNAVNVLQLSAKDDRGQQLYATMERQLGLLVHLIDDLLDVARISQDKLTLRSVATTLDAVLDAAIESVSPLLQTTGHVLQRRLPTQPVPLTGDPARLSQVFSNLLSNAAKYSDAGNEIVLAGRIDGERIVVSVEDRGIGLTPEQAAEVFEPFAQIDASIERARGGLGIGLTLVKRLAEMHGGGVVVHSAGLGHGCRFDVTLPLAPASADDAPPPSTDSPPVANPAASCRALVIDDNQDSADTLAMMLDLLGHETRRLYDPHAAVDTVEAFAPDVVFLDIGMPGLSGYDVARMLRATPAGKRLVLVAVTGWGQPDDRRRTGEAGFDHHLVKPPEMTAIRRICSELTVLPRSAA